MKAVVFHGVGDIRLDDVPEPKIQDSTDAMLSEQNEARQMISYNRVAGFVVTGNEDGAKSCISEMASAMVEVGFTVPPLAWTYWNMGPGPEYPDTDHGKEWSHFTARTSAPTTSSTSPGPCKRTPYPPSDRRA